MDTIKLSGQRRSSGTTNRIRNTFRQTVVFEHPCNAHVIKHNQVKPIDQLPAHLVSKVASRLASRSWIRATTECTLFGSYFSSWYAPLPIILRVALSSALSM